MIIYNILKYIFQDLYLLKLIYLYKKILNQPNIIYIIKNIK